MSIFQTHPDSITDLMDEIENGKLVLPEFQRSFRWETDRTSRLLSSIIAQFPTGALLFWGQHTPAGSSPAVERRAIEGAPSNFKPDYRFILDGQQRLTALYRALSGVAGEEERYFVNLKSLMDPSTLQLVPTSDVDWDAVVEDRQLNAKEKRDLAKKRKAAADKGDDPDHVLAEHDTITFAASQWSFPVHKLDDFDEWLDEFVDELPNGTDKKAVKKSLRDVKKTYLTWLNEYDYPVVTLDQGTSLVAVCRIFETLNRTAVTLGPFELLTAKFFPSGVKLRDEWEDALSNHPILEEFGVDPYAVLQAVTLRAHKSAQRSAVLNKLSATDFKKYWTSTVAGVSEAAQLVQDECGVMSSQWLPYQMLLVPLGAVWPKVEALKGAEKVKARQKLIRYFWNTAFTGNFDQGANSQAQADFLKLEAWIGGDDTSTPEAVDTKLPIRKDVIESATTRKTAYFKALIALLVKAGAQDFYEGKPMTPARVRQHQIEAHHIFPKEFLKGKGFSESPDLILNQAPINKKTNASIGKKAPSVYLAKLQKDAGSTPIKAILSTHYIDEQHLTTDDYSKFVAARLAAVVAEINNVIAPKKVV
jgi:uncharacterized protein with ParB-like and HNH nuclease domain